MEYYAQDATEHQKLHDDNFWKNELNTEQYEAVSYCDGPLLVIAGAGSGKTRVLTYKIAYLLEHGLNPWQILALTFTNKAAREMNHRISTIVGENYTRELWNGTFHSIFARILRTESQAIGFQRDFTIYDTSDQRSLIKSIIKEMQLDDKVYKPSIVADRISDAKNHLLLPNAYAADETLLSRDQIDNLGEIHRIYSTYWQRCRTANAMDFDDLLLYTYILFSSEENILQKYAKRFRYILVDEYQDTNYAQHMILSELTRDNHNICVVGDDAQSIYSFRGANIDNILHFTKQYAEARLIKLERNYRSTRHIVEAANSVIAHNRRQIPKQVYSMNSQGDPLTILPAASDKEEANKVASTIKHLVRYKDLDYNEMAVLYRTNAQSRSFEDVLRNMQIPYTIYGGISFYQRKEIKDIVAYLRLAINPYDEEALKRIVNYPVRGIGNTTLQKVISKSHEHNVPVWDVIANPGRFELAINKGTFSKLDSFVALITYFRALIQQENAYNAVSTIIKESGIAADIATEDGPEGQSKRENVEELLNSVAEYEKEQRETAGNLHPQLTDYVAQIALLTDADQQDDAEPKVTLMTIHAAKGLEYEAVFVTGLEEDLFPAASARFYPKEMEEERRLFYVAITRAKSHCYLTYARSRFRYGNMEFPEPSLFLREIDSRHVIDKSDPDVLLSERMQCTNPRQNAPSELFGMRSNATSGRTSFQSHSSISSTSSLSALPPFSSGSTQRTLRKVSTLPSSPQTRAATEAKARNLKVGTVISHDRFGEGTVAEIEGHGDSIKVIIDFKSAGRRTLLLKYAKFTVIQP